MTLALTLSSGCCCMKEERNFFRLFGKALVFPRGWSSCFWLLMLVAKALFAAPQVTAHIKGPPSVVDNLLPRWLEIGF